MVRMSGKIVLQCEREFKEPGDLTQIIRREEFREAFKQQVPLQVRTVLINQQDPLKTPQCHLPPVAGVVVYFADIFTISFSRL